MMLRKAGMFLYVDANKDHYNHIGGKVILLQ